MPGKDSEIMAVVKPFICIRPNQEVASQVAALPYDVYNRKEAKEAVAGKPLSFLNIDRPETQYGEDFDMYSDKAYETARDMLQAEIQDGTFIRDENKSYFLYELTMDGRVQTGIVACCSIEDYKNNIVKKHENTRAEKEKDRIRHIETVGAQTGPIFIAYRFNQELADIIAEVKKEECLYDFTGEDKVRHHVWKIDPSYNDRIEGIFAGIDSVYIADGHHRAASACKVGGTDCFLAVLFADSDLKIMAYNRAVKDLNGLSEEEFMAKLGEIYDIAPADAAVTPGKKGEAGFYLPGRWFTLTLKPEYASADPVKGLDVSLLQDYILDAVLDIKDPRTSDRISFIGGIRGNAELEKLVDKEGYAAAFSMYPTAMSELLSVADAGLLMPPKSTWFEPKLRSGIFIHSLKD